jgi:hypothetical protein
MQQNTLLESYLRQLKLPTFAQNYAAIASDAARTDLSCERYLLALCQAELAQRDANRVERCIAQARLPVLKEPLESIYHRRVSKDECIATNEPRSDNS